MKSKWLNCNVLILLLILIEFSSMTQYSFELPNEILNSKDMWHPHLRRKLLDENSFEIIDSRRKIYPTSLSLVQLKQSSNFLTEENKIIDSSKMKCGCRFVKQDIVQNTEIKQHTSLLEMESKVELKNDR